MSQSGNISGIAQLERDKARLERELAQARLIIEVQKKRIPLARDPDGRLDGREVIEAFDTQRSGLAVAVECQALGVPRATVYRARHRRRAIVSRAQPTPRPRPPLALSDA